MRAQSMVVGFGVLVAAASCGGGGSGGGGGGGASGGDKLFLGTTAGDDGASGVITLVVHPKSGSTQAVQAKVVTSGSSGVVCAGAPSPNPGSSCPGVSLPCGTSVCCDADTPFLCEAAGTCHGTAESAVAACGSSCSSCDGNDTPVAGSPSQVILTGTVDGDSVALSGDGWQVEGTLGGAGMAGQYADPSGGSGVFSAIDATDGAVTRYCGKFAGGDSGTWNLQVASSEASGAFAGSQASGTLTGSASAGSISLSFQSDFASGTADGSVGGDSVSGSWSTSDGSASGSWSGSSAACGAVSAKSADDCCVQTSRGLSCPIEGC